MLEVSLVVQVDDAERMEGALEAMMGALYEHQPETPCKILVTDEGLRAMMELAQRRLATIAPTAFVCSGERRRFEYRGVPIEVKC